MPLTVTGLDVFGLELKDLRRLGAKPARVEVYLDTHGITPAVIARRPEDRLDYLRQRAERWLAQLSARFPHLHFETEAHLDRSLPSSLSVKLPAREIVRLAGSSRVISVHVRSLSGARRRRKQRPRLDWYCVRGRVIVEIEGQRRGVQTIEDRFVVVRAESFHDAERRLRGLWREYAAPYLNSDMRLVRWRLEEVVDVYSITSEEMDSAGTEVYSELRERRRAPSRVWPPGRRS